MENTKKHRDLTAEDILSVLKGRIYETLTTEPWEGEDGTWYGVLGARDLAAMGGFLIKLSQEEDRKKLAQGGTMKQIAAIPALPPIGS